MINSIQDKLILNKANVLSTLANNPGLSCIGVIKNINDVNATSLMFLITPMHDKPGLLASVLNTFALFNINLSN
jgi:prephenate dehydratase